jgi:hypothetical protein
MSYDNHIRQSWSKLGVSSKDQDYLEKKLQELWFLLSEQEPSARDIVSLIRKIKIFEQDYGIASYDKPLPIEPEVITIPEINDVLKQAKTNKNPYLLGIVGPPGSGKSTLLDMLQKKQGKGLKVYDEYWRLDQSHDEHKSEVALDLAKNKQIVAAAGFFVDVNTDMLVYINQKPLIRKHNIHNRMRDSTDRQRARHFNLFRTFDFHVYELERVKADFKLEFDLRY